MCKNNIMYGKIIKELRQENNLTQKQLAEKLGCNQSMIARYEKEECEPIESIIVKTARLFNITSDYLLGLEI